MVDRRTLWIADRAYHDTIKSLLHYFFAVDNIYTLRQVIQVAVEFHTAKAVDARSCRRFSAHVAYARYVAIDFYIVNVDAELIRGIKVTEGNIFRAGRQANIVELPFALV